MKGVKLNRPLEAGVYPLREIATGLDDSPALHEMFGSREATVAALDMARAEIVDDWGYMWVDDEVGMLHIAKPYWTKGPDLHLYLDLCHELTHVRQFGEGKDLFDHAYAYVDRPTEIEAYKIAVNEARRLGMSEAELVEFLYVEWISKRDHIKLCTVCGVKHPDAK